LNNRSYTGISQNNQNDFGILYGAYPNPCNTIVNIGFELNKPGKINIIIYNLFGESVANIPDQYFT